MSQEIDVVILIFRTPFGLVVLIDMGQAAWLCYVVCKKLQWICVYAEIVDAFKDAPTAHCGWLDSRFNVMVCVGGLWATGPGRGDN